MSNRFVSASLAFLVGLLLGCGQATYDERLDNKMRDLRNTSTASDDSSEDQAGDTSDGQVDDGGANE